MKLSRAKIKERLFEHLNLDLGIKTKTTYDEVCYGSSYTDFTIKGLRNWKFSIWIRGNREKGFDVYFFGQHRWFIDKFKPNMSPFCIEIEGVKTDKQLNDLLYNEDNAAKFKWLMYGKEHPVKFLVGTYYDEYSPVYYSNIDGKKLKWLVETVWYYGIREPIKDWYIEYGQYVFLLGAKLIYKLRFGNKVRVKLKHRKEFFSPKWEFKIIYTPKAKDEDGTYCSTYEKINIRWNKYKEKYEYNWWILDRGVFQRVDLENIIEGETRGFYYKYDI